MCGVGADLAERQTLKEPAARVARPVERRIVDEHSTPRRAVVLVHVRGRDARQAELVESGLVHRRFAVDVADERHLDEIVRDPWIEGVKVMARNM